MSTWSRFASRSIACILALWLGGVFPARAVDLMDGKLQLHGFLTQGAVFTSDNNFLGGSEDNGSLDFREIGVNALWSATPDLHVSAQLLSHRTGDLDEGNVQLDYGMIDWVVVSGEGGRAGVRVGRQKLAYGLYNETRDVAHTRSGAILPQPVYFEMTRNLQMSADGLGVYLERYGEAGSLYASYQAGYPQADDRAVEAAFFGQNLPGRLDPRVSHIVNLTFEGDGGRYKLGVTSAWVGMDYEPSATDIELPGEIDFRPLIFSAQYNTEKWSLTAEHFYQFITQKGFRFPIHNITPTAQSYYVQAAYRPAPAWEMFMRYDEFYPDKDDRDGKKFSASTGGLPKFMAYAKDWSAGVRYDVTPQFMVRAELHQVNGTAWLSSLENPDPMRLEQHWNMFMLLGSFRF